MRTSSMKIALVSLAAFMLTAVLVPGTAPTLRTVAAQPKDKPAPEALPDAPKLDPKNAHVALSPDKSFLLEQNQDKKFLRVLVACEVCLREGSLEVFLCKK